MSDTALPIATAFIARAEAFRSAPYRDSGGVWTYGFGFTTTPDGKPVTSATQAISLADATTRLSDLVSRVMATVRYLVTVPTNDNQIAALTSMAYNCGVGALKTSTLLRLLNAGDIDGAANQFGAWVYDNGNRVPGLVSRRAAERELFMAGSVAPTQPAPIERPGIWATIAAAFRRKAA